MLAQRLPDIKPALHPNLMFVEIGSMSRDVWDTKVMFYVAIFRWNVVF